MTALINHEMILRRALETLQDLNNLGAIYAEAKIGPQEVLDRLTQTLRECDRLFDHLRAAR